MVFFCLSTLTKAQPLVKDGQESMLGFPWVGGMNSCQFAGIDMNMDGIEDLFVFDRNGDRIMTFINDGSQGPGNYHYDPQFVDRFPVLDHWVIIIDYDDDGLKDIFTYSFGNAGMKVYKNVSAGQLDFELVVYPYLTSFQGGIYTNILVTDVDYPGIADIDGDGDLDILTFWGLGAFVEYHKNLSMEKYGHADSLDYEKVENCWGHFAESEESNVITLDTCFGWGGQNVQLLQCPDHPGQNLPNRYSFLLPLLTLSTLLPHNSLLPHTGSTFLLIDMNADEVMDLLLGDVDYPTVVYLENGGTKDSAHMISQTINFPTASQKVNIFSMPVMAYVDIDNDAIEDLLVSPFDPSTNTAENLQSVWLYKNFGASSQPDFQLVQKNFLQEDMIDLGSGAYPVFADYNGDGLQDLFVGNYGYYDTSYYDEFMFLYSDYVGKIAVFPEYRHCRYAGF